MIRVAKVDYINGKFQYQHIDGFIDIIPLTEYTPHFHLSPYYLKDENNYIFENIWQFSKVYYETHKIEWKAPKAVFISNNEVNENYWDWRKCGFECPYPVRYPVGYYDRHK